MGIGHGGVDEGHERAAPGGLGTRHDLGERIPVGPCVELEPQGGAGSGGPDVLDRGGRIDGQDGQAAGGRGPLRGRPLAVRVQRPLDTDGRHPDGGPDGRAQERRGGRHIGDRMEDPRQQPDPVEGPPRVRGRPLARDDPAHHRLGEEQPCDPFEVGRVEPRQEVVRHRSAAPAGDRYGCRRDGRGRVRCAPRRSAPGSRRCPGGHAPRTSRDRPRAPRTCPSRPAR